MATDRTSVFYSRMKPINRKYLYAQMKADGFESMSLWFDNRIDKERLGENFKKKNIRKRNKKGTAN